jgi:hypothetical protein
MWFPFWVKEIDMIDSLIEFLHKKWTYVQHFSNSGPICKLYLENLIRCLWLTKPPGCCTKRVFRANTKGGREVAKRWCAVQGLDRRPRKDASDGRCKLAAQFLDQSSCAQMVRREGSSARSQVVSREHWDYWWPHSAVWHLCAYRTDPWQQKTSSAHL